MAGERKHSVCHAELCHEPARCHSRGTVQRVFRLKRRVATAVEQFSVCVFRLKRRALALWTQFPRAHVRGKNKREGGKRRTPRHRSGYRAAAACPRSTRTNLQPCARAHAHLSPLSSVVQSQRRRVQAGVLVRHNNTSAKRSTDATNVCRSVPGFAVSRSLKRSGYNLHEQMRSIE